MVLKGRGGRDDIIRSDIEPLREVGFSFKIPRQSIPKRVFKRKKDGFLLQRDQTSLCPSTSSEHQNLLKVVTHFCSPASVVSSAES